MKNDNFVIFGLLLCLFLLEFSNQLFFIRIDKKLNTINETIIQYFEAPLPDINLEEEQQDGRTE